MSLSEDESLQQLLATGTARQLRQRTPKNKAEESEDMQVEISQSAPHDAENEKQEFDSEMSEREMRKLNRRMRASRKPTETKRPAEKYEKAAYIKTGLYDAAGCLVGDGRDLCDCLEADCPGCHMPCPKCDSEKCGLDCRQNRRWMYYEVEIEGADKKFEFTQ